MSAIRYTADGRKVVIIGKANKYEYIVKEIFLSEGREIAGGETFVTSNLYDSFAETWQKP